MSYKQPVFSASSYDGNFSMPDDPNLSVDSFINLSPVERVQLCAKSAERAHQMAKNAQEPHKGFYIEIAQQWLQLAEAILRDEYPDTRYRAGGRGE